MLFRIPLIMLYVLLVGRKGISYLQLIPGVFFTETLYLISLLCTKPKGFVRILSYKTSIATLLIFCFVVMYVLVEVLSNSVSILNVDYIKSVAILLYPIGFIVGASYASTHYMWLIKGKKYVVYISVALLSNSLVSLLYPIKDDLIPFIPEVSSGVPLVLTFAANTVFLPIGFFFFLLVEERKPIRLVGLISSFLGILLLMERAAFLSLLVGFSIIIVKNLHKRQLWIKGILSGVLLIFVLIILIALPSPEVSKNTNHRVDFSVSGFSELITSIFVETDNDRLDGSRSHRLEMWGSLIEDLHDKEAVLFGRGFDASIEEVLGITFRSPHNGYVHVLWRTGLLGFLLLALFMISLLSSTNKLYRSQRNKTKINKTILWLLVIVVIAQLDVFTGTLLENPFSSGVIFYTLGLLTVLVKNEN